MDVGRRTPHTHLRSPPACRRAAPGRVSRSGRRLPDDLQRGVAGTTLGPRDLRRSPSLEGQGPAAASRQRRWRGGRAREGSIPAARQWRGGGDREPALVDWPVRSPFCVAAGHGIGSERPLGSDGPFGSHPAGGSWDGPGAGSLQIPGPLQIPGSFHPGRHGAAIQPLSSRCSGMLLDGADG